MITALILQSTYTTVEIGLFHQGSHYTHSEHKHTASKHLLTRIDELLSQAGITKNDIMVIGVNRGPAPFTTLRTTITTANGIAFALDKPMIGIDGLRAMLTEFHAPAPDMTLCLYDAFGKEVYYGIADGDTIEITGCMKLEELLKNCAADNRTYTCIGTGAIQFTEIIKSVLGDKATIADNTPEHPTLEYIYARVEDAWNRQETVKQIEPLYIKAAQF